MPIWAGINADGGGRSNGQDRKIISTMSDIFEENGP